MQRELHHFSQYESRIGRFGSTRFRQARLETRTRLISFKPGGVNLLEAAVVAKGLQPTIDKSRKGGVALQPVGFFGNVKRLFRMHGA
jgi:hypothetical protein